MADFLIRPATPADGAFLADMVVEAANWRLDAHRSKPVVLADPVSRGYIAGWQRPADRGVVAVDAEGSAVGAAWFRLFSPRAGRARVRRDRGARADHRRASALAGAGRRPVAHAIPDGCRAVGRLRPTGTERGARQLRARPLSIRGVHRHRDGGRARHDGASTALNRTARSRRDLADSDQRSQTLARCCRPASAVGRNVGTMATSTRSNGRASGTPSRGSGSRTAPTKKLPAATTKASAASKKAAAAAPTGPNLLVRVWMGLAHVAGGAARALGPETLQKEERRDGLPFFIVVLAICGAVVEWFFINESIAQTLDSWTFGGLFGRVAFALPGGHAAVRGVAVPAPELRARQHPHRHRARCAAAVGVGALPHLRRPARTERGHGVLARAGGILGWMLAQPLILLITPVGATIVVILLVVLSLLIMTKTPPNRIPAPVPRTLRLAVRGTRARRRACRHRGQALASRAQEGREDPAGRTRRHRRPRRRGRARRPAAVVASQRLQS